MTHFPRFDPNLQHRKDLKFAPTNEVLRAQDLGDFSVASENEPLVKPYSKRRFYPFDTTWSGFVKEDRIHRRDLIGRTPFLQRAVQLTWQTLDCSESNDERLPLKTLEQDRTAF